MSRIYDALLKSEKRLRQTFLRPDRFLETMEEVRGLEQVAVVQARLRPEARIVVASDPRSLGAERFRLLRARLNQWRATKEGKSLLITSALPQDGKSLTALNLAAAMARQEKQRVLLVECDLRRPRLCALLGVPVGPGLADVLQHGIDPLSVLKRVEPLGYYMLPAGQPPANPVELLQPPGLPKLIQTLKTQFDWILFDAPPAAPLADTLVLKPHLDGTLFVVRAGVTSREAIEEAVTQLGAEHVVGVVLNAAEGLERTYYQYYHPKALGRPHLTGFKKKKKALEQGRAAR